MAEDNGDREGSLRAFERTKFQERREDPDVPWGPNDADIRASAQVLLREFEEGKAKDDLGNCPPKGCCRSQSQAWVRWSLAMLAAAAAAVIIIYSSGKARE